MSDQLAEIDRELRLWARVYPRWVEGRKVTPVAAARQMERLQAVRATLVALIEAHRQQGELGLGEPQG